MIDILCKNLSISYGEVDALNGLDLHHNGGGIIGLLGVNGSGKTTLLRILAGLEMSYLGEVSINGIRPSHETKSFVSYQPDHIPFGKNYRISEILKIYGNFFEDFDRRKCSNVLVNLGLKENMRLREMSKGMQDKLMIALSLCRNSDLYLLDEPISGVDVSARKEIREIILDIYNPESIILISTHMIRTIEPLLDRAILMEQGKILMNDEVDVLRSKFNRDLEGTFEEVYK